MAPDLKELLRDAAARPANPLDLDDVRRRAAGVARGRRLRTAVAGMAVVVLVVAVAVPFLRMVDGPAVEFADTPPGESGEKTGQNGAPPQMWESLPRAPIVPRVGAASVWTGNEMIVWGGLDPARAYQSLADGAAYDPDTGAWRVLADPPIKPNTSVSAVWTGTVMIVWVPQRDVQSALSYDPARDEWTVLPPPPSVVLKGMTTVWTGTEMIVWGGHDQDGGARRGGLAYDPVAQRWRETAVAPITGRFRHGGVWTGKEMIVWGGSSGDGAAVSRYADGAAYDPVSDTWRAIAEAPLAARDPGGVLWTGKEMLVLGGFTGDNGVPARDGAAYNAAKDAWRELPEIGLSGITTFAWAGDQVVAWGADASSALMMTPRGGGLVLPGSPGQLGDDAAAAWTGEQLIIWGGIDGNEKPVDDGAVLNTAAYPAGPVQRPGRRPPDTAPDEQVIGGDLEPGAPPAGEEPPPRADAAPLPLWPIGHDHEDPVWDDPQEAAIAFGRDVLGWNEARCAKPVATGQGGSWAGCELHGGPASRWVFIAMAPDPDRGWVVTSVNVPDIGDTSLSVWIRGRRVQVSFGGWNGPPRLGSAELLVEYPDQGAQATASSEPLTFDVKLSKPPQHAGSVLILFRDAQGGVVGAQGMGVPAGDFAAS